MKKPKRLLCFILIFFAAAETWAGSSEEQIQSTTKEKTQAVSLDLFEWDSSYVFASDLHRDGSFGDQYAIQNSFSYGHRFLLNGHLYLYLGVSYDRFDFGATGAPVPEHMQIVAGTIGLDFMHDNDVGAFFKVQPGFYTEDDFDSSSFDAPITLGRVFVLQPDKLYLFAGVNAAFLRGQLPVLPLAGVIWMPNDQWKFLGILPEPRIIYAPSKKLNLWVGGQLTGGSFRTNRDDTIVPHKLSNAQVDYTDYRVGGGFIYSPSDAITFDFGAGYSLQRKFDFNRADMSYKTDGAPYLRLEFSAKF